MRGLGAVEDPRDARTYLDAVVASAPRGRCATLSSSPARR